jgi:hypothetical protein
MTWTRLPCSPCYKRVLNFCYEHFAAFYLGLGLFASSALISIFGSIVVSYGWPSGFQMAAGIGIVCGTSAFIALVCGCVLMIRETQLAVESLI